MDGIDVRRHSGNMEVHIALPLFLAGEEFDAAICDLGHAVPFKIINLINTMMIEARLVPVGRRLEPERLSIVRDSSLQHVRIVPRWT